MSNPKIKVLVPMKKNSERVPNKNMRLFNGKPLYHWVVKTVLDSPYVSEVIINTDSEDIKNDALINFERVRIIDRAESIQGDFVSMNAVIEYDLKNSEGEHFMQTHSTNPLLKTSTINKAIETYFNNLEKHDSVFGVTMHQTRLYWEDGSPVNHNPNELLRTQDLPPLFEENSNFYLFSKETFLGNDKKRIGKKPKMVAVDKLEAVDIDNMEDFIIAELLHKRLYKSDC
jgi:CMP-N-acetylneuraminic acid synthetase